MRLQNASLLFQFNEFSKTRNNSCKTNKDFVIFPYDITKCNAINFVEGVKSQIHYVRNKIQIIR